jgi:hypothetical protein
VDTIGVELSDGLVVHDSTNDVVLKVLSAVEELSILASILFGVFNIDLFESLTTSTIRLIRGKDTFTRGRK